MALSVWGAIKISIWTARIAMLGFNAIASINPFAWIGIVIGLMALLYTKFEGFRAVIDAIWSVVKKFLTDFWNGLKQIIKGIVSMFSGLGKIIGAFFGGGTWKDKWKKIKEGAAEVGNGFINTTKGTIKTLQPGLKSCIIIKIIYAHFKKATGTVRWRTKPKKNRK